MKRYWEIIADNLHKAGWSLGWVSALGLEGRTIWIVDAHGYGKRFIVRADEMLTASVELERAICVGLLTEQIRRRHGTHIKDLPFDWQRRLTVQRPDTRVSRSPT